MKKQYLLFNFLLLFLNSFVFGQSTIVIGEVLYDTPLTETTSKHNGEFLSLYNYGDDSTDISGWRVEVTSLMSANQVQYNYTIPAGSLLPMYSLAIIASRAANDTFNVVEFYGSVNPGWHIVLYNNSLTLPNTRSQIKIYDADNIIQDEMVYDGTTAKLPDEQLLRAENGFNPDSLGSQSVSIQRRNITISDDVHIFNRTDYYPHNPEQLVRMFSFIPPDYSFIEDQIHYSPGSGSDFLSLSGVETENNRYEANDIESTQIIDSGKTTYRVDNTITLNPGFEVKLGAEFEAAIVDSDNLHNLTIVTYNLGPNLQSPATYELHADVIEYCNPDIVSLQEVRLFMPVTGLIGFAIPARIHIVGNLYLYLPGGNVLLYNKSTVGNLKSIVTRYMDTPKQDVDRCYTIAEFRDFYVIVTHYPTNDNDKYQTNMSNAILNEDIVKNYKKPVYIAGDMNAQRGDTAINILKASNFEVLNDTNWKKWGLEEDYIDLILEYNTNRNHKVFEREFMDFRPWKISDHQPYRVKVKIK